MSHVVQVVAFATANFYMEYWKQKSLATFESLFIVPVFQVSWPPLSSIRPPWPYEHCQACVAHPPCLAQRHA